MIQTGAVAGDEEFGVDPQRPEAAARWKLDQVEEPVMADILNGMHVDLVRRLRRQALEPAGKAATQRLL
ncbi:hypothetical protein AB0N99_26250 [Streptomyces sp. NPDC093272]|uniref:hypothetical protein n=1 Tax=Streptomyces sp. NPDC093272 TaxID=3154981 RepID=UPI00342C85A0